MSIYKYGKASGLPPPPPVTVTFDTAFGSQFIKQTTPNGLYDVYTIIGQSGTVGTTLTTWSDFTVNATFESLTPKTIYYVCVGGGGYTYIQSSGTGFSGGGGAGAYFEGSYSINGIVSFVFNAGGSYKTSFINSTTYGNLIAGYGGYSNRATSIADNGINGSSGGGGGAGNSSTNPPGTGNPPGTNGGTGASGTSRGGGGGGGAGGAGGNASGGTGGIGGIGKIPTGLGISTFYTSQLCVGGNGGGTISGIGAQSSTYGSGAGGRTSDGNYRYGSPGAIIIAVPKT